MTERKIDSLLDAPLKVINIGLVPILLTIGGLLAFIGMRSWRRRTY